MRTKSKRNPFVILSLILVTFSLMACQGGSLFPETLGTGSIENADLNGESLLPEASLPVPGENVSPLPQGSGNHGFGQGGFAAVPTQDAGEVGPVVDMDEIPLISMGTSELICQYDDGEFLFKMSGRLRWNPPEDQSDQFYDVEPGPQGMTLRLIHRDDQSYMDFPVEPVVTGACIGPGLCQKNYFVARFKTSYPLPHSEQGGPMYTFWLSETNHEAEMDQQWQDCSEAPIPMEQAELTAKPGSQSHDHFYSFCKPKHWEFVATAFHSFKNPPETAGVLPCKIYSAFKDKAYPTTKKMNFNF